MDKPITNIKLGFSCPVKWDEMEDLGSSRFCNHCNKQVYDFTNSKAQEFLKIVGENGNDVCGRYTKAQTMPVCQAGKKWQKWLSAAALLIGVSLLNEKAHGQQKSLNPVIKQKQAERDLVVGFIGTAQLMPEFPGGASAYEKFMLKNIHWKPGMKNGRVFASFTIKPDGTPIDLRIVRGLTELNDTEVIRVLKMMPKWKPAVQDGKPVSVVYTLPVNFVK